MKKIIFTIIFLVMFIFAGCSQNSVNLEENKKINNCQNECEIDTCNEYGDVLKCERDNDGCKIQVNRGKEIGKCGIDCITDNQCNNNEVCSNFECVIDLSESYIENTPENNDEEILENIKQTIVWVKYDVSGKNSDGSYFEAGSSGSGVIVSNNDNELKVYTNRHVVDCEFNDMDCYQRLEEKVQVRTQDGVMHNVDEVAFSKSDIDLAILTIKTKNAKNYDFAYYSDNFEIDDKVIAVGYPSFGVQNVVEFSVSEGKITNTKELLSQSTGTGFKAIYSDAYTYFGSSGGGLFDENGNLIGINTWISGTQTSIAIDFSSISEESFVYCNSNSYFANGDCYRFCDRDEVMTENRACVQVCDEFYCNSKQPSASDSRCKDSGYILGSEGYCHLPCGSSTSYCGSSNSICLNNHCYSECDTGYLYEDGTCRLYE